MHLLTALKSNDAKSVYAVAVAKKRKKKRPKLRCYVFYYTSSSAIVNRKYSYVKSW